MRDRRRVGLADHSDQRQVKISRIEGGFAALLSPAQAHTSEMPEEATYFGKPGRLGRHALSVFLQAAPEGAADRVLSPMPAHLQPPDMPPAHHTSSASGVNSNLDAQQKQRVRLSLSVCRRQVTSNQRTIDRHVLRIQSLEPEIRAASAIFQPSSSSSLSQPPRHPIVGVAVRGQAAIAFRIRQAAENTSPFKTL
jgi:hypothetical protein